MQVDSIIPKRSLPRTVYASTSESAWVATDTFENYAQRKGHPVYSATDITYNFNSLGYRCCEFGKPPGLKLLAIGCSYVMGVGLPRQRLFHEVFAKKLSTAVGAEIVVWNLALPGAPNDYMSRMLHLAVPLLNPDFVFVNFTHAERREYFSKEGRWMPYVPGYEPYDRDARDVKYHLQSLSSQPDDDLNLFRNYRSIETLLHDRLWLFSTISSGGSYAGQLDRIASHIDFNRYAGALSDHDLARDWCHPGPLSHAVLAEGYWKRFIACDGLRIAAKRSS